MTGCQSCLFGHRRHKLVCVRSHLVVGSCKSILVKSLARTRLGYCLERVVYWEAGHFDVRTVSTSRVASAIFGSSSGIGDQTFALVLDGFAEGTRCVRRGRLLELLKVANALTKLLVVLLVRLRSLSIDICRLRSVVVFRTSSCLKL